MNHHTTMNEDQRKLKFIVLGDSSVGKTELLNSYIMRDWLKKDLINIKPTRGIDIFIEEKIIDGDHIMIEFIELEGDYDEREKMNIFLNIYFKENSAFNKFVPFHGIIFIFNTNQTHSLNSCKNWLKWFHLKMKTKIFEKDCNLLKPEKKGNIYDNFLDIPILFLGNTIDGGINRVDNKIDEKIQKSQKFILSNFSFKNNKNLFFILKKNSEKLNDILNEFVFQTYQMSINSRSQNTNYFNDDNLIDYSQYTLKEFMYLKTFNFRQQKNFFQKLYLKFTK